MKVRPAIVSVPIRGARAVEFGANCEGGLADLRFELGFDVSVIHSSLLAAVEAQPARGAHAGDRPCHARDGAQRVGGRRRDGVAGALATTQKPA